MQLKCKKMCVVYGEGAVIDEMCQKWFAKISAGDFLLEDAPQLGRPVVINNKRVTGDILLAIQTSLTFLPNTPSHRVVVPLVQS